MRTAEKPPDLTGDQRTTLAAIAQDNSGHYRAYPLTEQLREIFACHDTGTPKILPAGWISCAQRSRLPAFVKLTKTITRYRKLILNPVEHDLSNARSEATNTHLRLLPTSLRLPQPRRPDRHRRPHPLRPLPTTPRKIMTTHPQKRQQRRNGSKRS